MQLKFVLFRRLTTKIEAIRCPLGVKMFYLKKKKKKKRLQDDGTGKWWERKRIADDDWLFSDDVSNPAGWIRINRVVIIFARLPFSVLVTLHRILDQGRIFIW